VVVGDGSAAKSAWRYHDSGFGGGIEAWSLDDDLADVLPLFPGHLLANALRRLSANDRILALRHKIVAVSVRRGVMHYACVTRQAEWEARWRGLRVVARIDAADYRHAVHHVLGPTLLRQAVFQLDATMPAFSARLRLWPEQVAAVLLIAAAATLAALMSDPGYVALAASLLAGLFFAMTVAIRIFAITPMALHDRVATPAISQKDLPVYTILVPLFRETAVLEQLLGAMMALNYPAAKLDIKLILEEEDITMQRAVARLPLPPHFEVVVVPAGKPQTKPRALNYGLQFARGALLTIYDSEDIPDRNQLRDAATLFAAAGKDLACLQATLTYFNASENWLTRQFTAEYAALFNLMLPQLAACGLPLPLGGTSNHFRVSALLAAGGWDPFNVTEDADLGYRLARLGYTTDCFPSRTYEEANTQLGNWMRQRRRWLKGFLHTWLVHMRQPISLLQRLGASGFLVMQCMSIGVFASALLHPFLLMHALWFFASGEASAQLMMPLHGLAIGLNGAILILGYGSAILCARAGLRKLGIRHWLGTLLSMPIYWMLMTPAAWLALWDFIVRPHHWHKTEHGLSAMLRRTTINSRH
jgi:glycosyltransferase XagB